MLRTLEERLKVHLRCESMLMVSSGTIGLQIAIRALRLTGEIITTPFSYIATANSIVWEHCTPVFVDIDDETYNINPSSISAAITDRTTGILATHVFGNPCDIVSIANMTEDHNLRVIYDAAHSFGVEYNGTSVLNYGDISVSSFHATKIYHTVEGGGIVSSNPDLVEQCKRLRNFGHAGTYDYDGVGINGKNSELHAAMGLCMLGYIDELISNRKQQYLRYQEQLSDTLLFQLLSPQMDIYNYAYCPVLFPDEATLLRVIEVLHQREIFPRRYFYPSLDQVVKPASIVGDLNAAHSIANRILCLPLYNDLCEEDIDAICQTILSS